MKQLFVLALIVVGSLVGVDRAFAQEGPAGAGRTEITLVPGGAVLFAESHDASAPSFGNYQLGGAVGVNLNRFIGLEGEIGSSVGISQSLDFGYGSSVRTPDILTYSGNVVVSVPTGSSIVPYFTGGAGGLSVFSREALGVNENETRFAANAGGGVKWYAGRWGLRADYRFIAIPSVDTTSAFFSTQPRYGHRVYGAILLNVGR